MPRALRAEGRVPFAFFDGMQYLCLPTKLHIRDVAQRGRPFTALMAYDDIKAQGAMRALAKLDIKVPE